MKFLFLTSLLFMVTPINAQPLEIFSMKQILPHVEPQTLVVFDIDNTLARPPQTLGSDQWFAWLVQQYEKKGQGKEEAKFSALKAWQRVQLKTPMKPVEPSTPRLVRYLQEKGIAVFALTARPASLAQRTASQLYRMGIDLRSTTPFPDGMSFKLPYKNTMYKGVMAVGFNNKGEVMANILKRSRNAYRKVLFIDDKLHHAQNVEQEVSQMGIKAQGFRYGAADAWVRSFRPSIAVTQSRYFDRILDDAAAAKLNQ